jgi:hypothetical protein
MIVKAANVALCDLLEPVLLVLIVSLCKEDYYSFPGCDISLYVL